MINCQHAHQLFDRYLDGELSASLQTELHAHRLSCSACQNELALLEACGDVITMDRCEPQVSESFTQRVVLAQRGRRVSKPRRWGRKLLLAGSPMAAAASIAFTLFVVSPSTPTSAVKTVMESAPPKYQIAGSNKSAEALKALHDTPSMDTETFETLITRLVGPTVQGTRRGAEGLQALMRMGFSNPNLIARFQAAQQNSTATSSDSGDPDLFVPKNLIDPPADPESTRQPENTEQPGPV